MYLVHGEYYVNYLFYGKSELYILDWDFLWQCNKKLSSNLYANIFYKKKLWGETQKFVFLSLHFVENPRLGICFCIS